MDADVDDGVWRMWRKGAAVSIFIAALFSLFLKHDYVFYESAELDNRSVSTLPPSCIHAAREVRG